MNEGGRVTTAFVPIVYISIKMVACYYNVYNKIKESTRGVRLRTGALGEVVKREDSFFAQKQNFLQ